MLYTRKKRFSRYLKLVQLDVWTVKETTEFNTLRHCPDNPEIRIMEAMRLQGFSIQPTPTKHTQKK